MRTFAGKVMPLDAEPNPAGNVTLERVYPASERPVRAWVHATVAGAGDLERRRAEGAELWMPHHATCPNWPGKRRR